MSARGPVEESGESARLVEAGKIPRRYFLFNLGFFPSRKVNAERLFILQKALKDSAADGQNA
ncbi:hypothetical protein [Pseudomonas oryzihabitans]|uniref:hypothetical protein n=1 Tax=Pseudomonas oryzihabitans TaxID=47885 RepID=UPI00123BB248|nr:hypothetical protein [Pseudomonas oryzihabitans]QEU01794.1 hypothetical protein FOB65_00180 [Pseudomonas oryzihabitans]